MSYWGYEKLGANPNISPLAFPKTVIGETPHIVTVHTGVTVDRKSKSPLLRKHRAGDKKLNIDFDASVNWTLHRHAHKHTSHKDAVSNKAQKRVVRSTDLTCVVSVIFQ